MGKRLRLQAKVVLCLYCLSCAVAAGCTTLPPPETYTNLPREKSKFILPEYIIEPPDILLIDALRVTPLPPYRIAPLDSLLVQVTNAYPTEPITGLYSVDPDGRINLGLSYGSVAVVGLTIAQAKAAIETQLKAVLKEPKVLVSLARTRATQQIRGPHIVRQDGQVSLGVYGAVHVTGLTLPQAKVAIEMHLSQYLQNPEISVDMLGFNSKVYYVILDGAGNGQQVVRLPITGNETVLDAIAQVQGIFPVSDKHRIWVARPGPADAPCDTILPVDWVAITTRGRTATNYQLLPGDRVYVSGNILIAFDTFLQRLYSPFERTFGVLLLGIATVRSFGPGGGTSGTGIAGGG